MARVAQWQASTTTSTRRFFCRPSGLSEPSGFVLGATGRVFPYPLVGVDAGRNLWLHQPLLDSFGAPLAETLIVVRRANRVGMTFDRSRWLPSLGDLQEPSALKVSRRRSGSRSDLLKGERARQATTSRRCSHPARLELDRLDIPSGTWNIARASAKVPVGCDFAGYLQVRFRSGGLPTTLKKSIRRAR